MAGAIVPERKGNEMKKCQGQVDVYEVFWANGKGPSYHWYCQVHKEEQKKYSKAVEFHKSGAGENLPCDSDES